LLTIKNFYVKISLLLIDQVDDMVQENSYTFPRLDVLEHAFSALITAQGEQDISPVTHFIFRKIQHDPTLLGMFHKTFAPKIVREMQACASRGTLPDLAHLHMLETLYGKLPLVAEQKQQFLVQLGAQVFPWVKVLLKRVNEGLETALQRQDDHLLIQTFQEIQRYCALTNGEEFFMHLLQTSKEKVEKFFCAQKQDQHLQTRIAHLLAQLQKIAIDMPQLQKRVLAAQA